MDPLAFIAALLGVGGLGAIIKLVLNFVRDMQRQMNEALAEQRDGFELFLGNHMSEQTRAMQALTKATNSLANKASLEHSRLRSIIEHTRMTEE